MSGPAIRILVADDHPVVRDGLAATLGTQADFEVVGEVGDGLEALHAIRELAPDVLLLDLEMPELDGVGLLRALAEEPNGSDRPRAIAFTAFDTDERILGALEAGARGYLLKGVPREQLFAAVRTVHAGGSLLSPDLTARLVERIQASETARAGDGSEGTSEALTEREAEVLRALARGWTNREIARELGITERTVKFHVGAILAKLDAGNRTEAVRRALELGLVALETGGATGSEP